MIQKIDETRLIVAKNEIAEKYHTLKEAVMERGSPYRWRTSHTDAMNQTTCCGNYLANGPSSAMPLSK